MKEKTKINSSLKSEVWAPVSVGLLSIIVIAIGCIVEGSWSMAYTTYPLIVLVVIGLIKLLSSLKVQYFDSRKKLFEELLDN